MENQASLIAKDLHDKGFTVSRFAKEKYSGPEIRYFAKNAKKGLNVSLSSNEYRDQITLTIEKSSKDRLMQAYLSLQALLLGQQEKGEL